MKTEKISFSGKSIWDIFLAEENKEIAFWRVGEWWILAKHPVQKIVGMYSDTSKELEKKLKEINISGQSSARDCSGKRENSEELERKIEEIQKNSLDNCSSMQKKYSIPFSEGWVGVTRYDFGEKLLGIEKKYCRGELSFAQSLPLFEWRKYETVICENTKTREIFLCCDSKVTKLQRRDALQCVSTQTKKIKNYSLSSFREKYPQKIWEKGFDEVKKNIIAGEYYQMNLTQQFEADFTGNEKQLFYELYKKNPASHASFFGGKTYNILSASPELFLRFDGEKVSTEPIKGTRPREKNTDEDEQQKKELLESKKEKAELLMITDLLRNDIGQTCTAGSIHVEALRKIQKNPSVWHTFSRIAGKRKKNISALDVFFSCLPCGSISGCPKKRACQDIADKEPHSRGFFCGTFGFLNENGDGEFSIFIRTLLHTNGKIYFQAGGGITADSQKEEEWEEVMQKGKVFFEMGNTTEKNHQE